MFLHTAHPNRCGFCGGLECTVGLQPYDYGAIKSNLIQGLKYYYYNITHAMILYTLNMFILAFLYILLQN